MGLTSFGLYIAYIWVADNFSSFLNSYSIQQTFGSGLFYLIVIFNTGVVLSSELAVYYLTSLNLNNVSSYFMRLIKTKQYNDPEKFRKFEREEMAEEEYIEKYENTVTPTLIRPAKHDEK
jgi:hypothetical protein